MCRSSCIVHEKKCLIVVHFRSLTLRLLPASDVHETTNEVIIKQAVQSTMWVECIRSSSYFNNNYSCYSCCYHCFVKIIIVNSINQ